MIEPRLVQDLFFGRRSSIKYVFILCNHLFSICYHSGGVPWYYCRNNVIRGGMLAYNYINNWYYIVAVKTVIQLCLKLLCSYVNCISLLV